MNKKLSRVLSCIQPTAEMHIGNYFGAIVSWVALQEKHSCIYGVVNLHAMTMPYAPAELLTNTRRMVIDLLACGIDPIRSPIFIQSLVPEHTALYWILGCCCSYGDLSRMTQFKEKARQVRSQQANYSVPVGLFTYPVLQAADILIYKAHFVPVGKDQVQHLELARVIARRFNQQFAEIFPEPQPLLTNTPKLRSLADPSKKMSKSAGPKHYIGLFEPESSIRAKIRAAVTDSGDSAGGRSNSPGVSNLFEILRACGKEEVVTTLGARQRVGKLKYSDLKLEVVDALVALTTRLRAAREQVERSESDLEERIREMSERARRITAETLREVQAAVGLPSNQHSLRTKARGY